MCVFLGAVDENSCRQILIFFGFEGFLSNDDEENEGEMLRITVSMLYVNVTHGTHKIRDNPSIQANIVFQSVIGTKRLDDGSYKGNLPCWL